jgi:serine/threonine protein phosphatase PrpC
MTGTTELKPVLSFAEACDRGKVREENQDNVRHVSTALGELLIVADGIGGYRGGATASRMVVDSIEAVVAGQPADCSPTLAIAEAAAAANSNVREAAEAGDPAFHNMGSTVVLALITRKAVSAQVWIGHIGDSRAYLARGGRLVQLTHDHSAVQQMLDLNQITPEQARTSPQSSVLTRSIGHAADVEIEMSMVDLEEGDALLLCSDGLWGFVAEQAIEQVMVDPEMRVENAAMTLLNLALEAGGHDNIGIEVVRYSAPPAPHTPTATIELTGPLEPTAAAIAPAATVPEPETGPQFEVVFDEPARKSGGGFALLIKIVVLVGLLVLAWLALELHWIPNINLPR